MESIKNSIIYIDEVASFIESLTDNETMTKTLKKIYLLLMKLIKNAYKVIVSDALINDAVLELLKYRTDEDKIFIVNSYKKFENIEAVKINDENIFLSKIKNNILNGIPFLFPCDSCETITNFYLECLKTSPEQHKDKFMLITADSKIKINDASKELKNKFVFYSPSITYGVDFQSDTPQDVFMYIKGESIQPSGFYQQCTRTRNMNKLYYYCKEHQETPKFNTLLDTHNYYKNIINATNLNLLNICVSIDENDEEKINENTFFNLFCYNEFVKDTYKTNKLKHFEDILINKGFILTVIGQCNELENKEDFKEHKKEYDEKLFYEYIEIDEETKKQNKFNSFNEHIETFKLKCLTNDELIKIKSCIMNKFYFNEILIYNRLLKSEDYINFKIHEIEKESYKVKCYNTCYHKIKILMDLCNKYNMNIFNLECNYNDKIEFTAEYFELFKTTFNSTTSKQPTNKEELIKFIVNIYKVLMPNLNLIDTKIKKIKVNGNSKRFYEYTFNKNSFNHCNEILKIYKFIKPNDINKETLNNCNIDFIDFDETDDDDSDDDEDI